MAALQRSTAHLSPIVPCCCPAGPAQQQQRQMHVCASDGDGTAAAATACVKEIFTPTLLSYLNGAIHSNNNSCGGDAEDVEEKEEDEAVMQHECEAGDSSLLFNIPFHGSSTAAITSTALHTSTAATGATAAAAATAALGEVDWSQLRSSVRSVTAAKSNQFRSTAGAVAAADNIDAGVLMPVYNTIHHHHHHHHQQQLQKQVKLLPSVSHVLSKYPLPLAMLHHTATAATITATAATRQVLPYKGFQPLQQHLQQRQEVRRSGANAAGGVSGGVSGGGRSAHFGGSVSGGGGGRSENFNSSNFSFITSTSNCNNSDACGCCEMQVCDAADADALEGTRWGRSSSSSSSSNDCCN